MRSLGLLERTGRNALGVALEALLIAAIIAMIVVMLAPVSAAAQQLAGTGRAAAARGVITVPDGVYAGTTTATVNPGGSTAWVFAECRQNGEPVYRQYKQVDANNQAVLTLGPTPSWTGGSADCTAQEGYWSRGGRWRAVAETDFFVAG